VSIVLSVHKPFLALKVCCPNKLVGSNTLAKTASISPNPYASLVSKTMGEFTTSYMPEMGRIRSNTGAP
jgi:hypothetical protein